MLKSLLTVTMENIFINCLKIKLAKLDYIKGNYQFNFNDIKKILITGGLGFIGSYLIKKILSKTEDYIFNLDFQGYASDARDIKEIIKLNPHLQKRYQFNHVDLKDYKALKDAVNTIQPDLIFHLAAESHVDRSIDMPINFLRSNVIGTFNICEVIRSYFANLPASKRNKFKLLHISTDEVFGSLSSKGFFNEYSRYNPSSPYSATKAASDHFVRAWQKTYGIP